LKAKFNFDPAQAVAHLRESDEKMRALIDRVGGFALQIKPTRSLFDAMLRSIVYQQLHGKAAAAIHARVLTILAKHGGATPEALASATDAELRGAGLSGNKLLAVRDLAAKCLEGTVPTLKEVHKLGEDELVERLTAVRGIGPWTVHMLLIFYLGRGDVFPTGDFAVRLAVKKLYRKRKDPSPAAMLKIAQPWRPYRSVASWYLWRSLDTDL
jgi:3-methyladenine DNA glycosylase/8-oxoguanine DNA glycosylase